MSKYNEKEREKVIKLIKNSELFEKCKAGKFRGKEYDFVLLNGDYNLIKSIRKEAITYFDNTPIIRIYFIQKGTEPFF